MTDAHAAAPAIDRTNPLGAEALARVDQLAAAHASLATSDWSALPSVLSTVVSRG